MALPCCPCLDVALGQAATNHLGSSGHVPHFLNALHPYLADWFPEPALSCLPFEASACHAWRKISLEVCSAF